MKKLSILLLLTATVFAQTGGVYISDAAETREARQLYSNVEKAKEQLVSEEKSWEDFKTRVKKHHIINNNAYVNFNSEFTTFEINTSVLSTNGMTTYVACCCPSGFYR